MRLIDADALLTDRRKRMYYHLPNGDTAIPIIDIEHAPTIDKRKTGHWKIKAINTFELAYGSTGYEPVYECSECGGVEESYLRLDEPIMPEDADFPRFCPNCGADMRGGQEEKEYVR